MSYHFIIKFFLLFFIISTPLACQDGFTIDQVNSFLADGAKTEALIELVNEHDEILQLSQNDFAAIDSEFPGFAWFVAQKIRNNPELSAIRLQLLRLYLENDSAGYRQMALTTLIESEIANGDPELAARSAAMAERLLPRSGRLLALQLRVAAMAADADRLTIILNDQQNMPFISESDALFYNSYQQSLTDSSDNPFNPAWQLFFTQQPVSNEKWSLINVFFPAAVPDNIEPLTDWWHQLIIVRRLNYLRQYDQAAQLWQQLLASASPSQLNMIGPEVADEIRRAFYGSNRTGQAVALLEEVFDDRDMPAPFWFIKGRFYRYMQRYPAALECFTAAQVRTSIDEFERILWYRLYTEIDISTEVSAKNIDFYLSHIIDFTYFDDAINRMLTRLVQERRWQLISDMADKLHRYHADGLTEAYERAAFITAIAIDSGLLSMPTTRLTQLLNNLAENSRISYYRFMASILLANRSETNEKIEVDINVKTTITTESNDNRPAETIHVASRYIEQALHYGLIDSACDYATDTIPLLEWQLLRPLLDRLAADGEHLKKIRLANRHRFYSSGELNIQNAADIFPVPEQLQATIEQMQNLFPQIPPELLYALIRQESGFSSTIISSAGAVGLMQLLPSTAEDMAVRHRIDSYSLTDSYDNILLGCYYLQWLDGYIGVSAPIISAYNGGPGRIRGWLQRDGDLPELLWPESVGINETRYYLTSITAAAIIYSQHHFNKSPLAICKYLFPKTF